MWGLFGMFGSYDYDPEYYNLTKEEQNDFDLTRNILMYSSEKVSDACGKMQLLLLEISSKYDSEEELSDDEIQAKKSEIYSELNEEEKETVDSFVRATINTMGIYSDEAKEQRRLKKKGND